MMSLSQKKIHILQVAERLFSENGFDGTSIRAISKEAGINIAMISYYFGSKEKLLEELILYRASDIRVHIENILRANLSPIEKLEKYIEFYIQQVSRNFPVYRIAMTESQPGRRNFQSDEFAKVKKVNLENLKRIVIEGQESGQFRSDIEPTLIPATIAGTVINFYINREFFSGLLNLSTREAFDNYVKQNLTNYLKTIIKASLLNE